MVGQQKFYDHSVEDGGLKRLEVLQYNKLTEVHFIIIIFIIFGEQLLNIV